MKKYAVAFIICVFMIIPAIGQADDGRKPDESVRTLETVVVTGIRTEEAIEKVPANITVIDQEDIKESNAKNVVDLLKYEGGIFVKDLLGNGKSSQVDLRGFGETGPYNTLVLVDGRRVNEIDLSAVDWAQIPLEQIDHIEILRGTGTVLYGDNAVGGVINIITKIPSKKFTFSGGAVAGSYGRNKEQISVSGGGQNIGADVTASYDSTEGYRENGEYRTKDVGGKIIYDPFEALRLNLRGSYHSDGYGLPGELSEDEVAMNRRGTIAPFNGAESRDGYLSLRGDLDLNDYGNIIADFSYRKRDIESQFINFTSESRSQLKTRGFTPRYVWDGELMGRENTFIAGVDVYLSELDGESYFGTPIALTGISNIEKKTAGFYFNNEMSLLDKLILSIGARRERVRYDLKQTDLTGFFAPLDARLTQRENAYSAGLTYLYKEKSSIFARTNRSLRFPLTDELIVFDFVNGQINANPDLKPQRGTHYEIGVRHRFTPGFQGNLTLYRAKIKDEIFFNKPVFTNENHPETLHQGMEIGGEVDIVKRLTLFGNYTYTRAEFEKDPFKGKELPGVPRHKANLGLRIHDFFRGAVLSANYRYTGTSYLISDLGNDYEKLDDYYSIDMKLSYKWRRVTAFLGVNNLTNEEYSEYAVIGRTPVVRTFYPSPERNWAAGLEMTF